MMIEADGARWWQRAGKWQSSDRYGGARLLSALFNASAAIGLQNTGNHVVLKIRRLCRTFFSAVSGVLFVQRDGKKLGSRVRVSRVMVKVRVGLLVDIRCSGVSAERPIVADRPMH